MAKRNEPPATALGRPIGGAEHHLGPGRGHRGRGLAGVLRPAAGGPKHRAHAGGAAGGKRLAPPPGRRQRASLQRHRSPRDGLRQIARRLVDTAFRGSAEGLVMTLLEGGDLRKGKPSGSGRCWKRPAAKKRGGTSHDLVLDSSTRAMPSSCWRPTCWCKLRSSWPWRGPFRWASRGIARRCGTGYGSARSAACS